MENPGVQKRKIVQSLQFGAACQPLPEQFQLVYVVLVERRVVTNHGPQELGQRRLSPSDLVLRMLAVLNQRLLNMDMSETAAVTAAIQASCIQQSGMGMTHSFSQDRKASVAPVTAF